MLMTARKRLYIPKTQRFNLKFKPEIYQDDKMKWPELKYFEFKNKRTDLSISVILALAPDLY